MLANRDLITFLCFTGCFLFVLFAQVNVKESFMVNESLNNAIVGEEPKFDEVHTKRYFTVWLQYLLD